jgi:hypothetical protein
MVFPTVTPPNPRGPWFEETWIYVISESSHVNMTYSGSVVLEKKTLKLPDPIFVFLWLSPLWRGSSPLFEQFRIPFTQAWFESSFIEFDIVFPEIFFFNINICKYGFPFCGPTQPPGTMMWTILNLHYIRMLSCKYDLFWLSRSGEDVYITPPHFCNFVIISPFKRTWPFIWTI